MKFTNLNKIAATPPARSQNVSPTKILKSSEILKKKRDSFNVIGERERTYTGYLVRSYVGKDFETYFESMIAGAVSPTYEHATKSICFSIISGHGLMVTEAEDGIIVEQGIASGSQVSVPPKTKYRIKAAVQGELAFFVSQSSGYEAKRKTVEETEQLYVSEDLLRPVHFSAPVARREYSKSDKAAQQLIEMRRQHTPVPEKPGTMEELERQMNAAMGVDEDVVDPLPSAEASEFDPSIDQEQQLAPLPDQALDPTLALVLGLGSAQPKPQIVPKKASSLS